MCIYNNKKYMKIIASNKIRQKKYLIMKNYILIKICIQIIKLFKINLRFKVKPIMQISCIIKIKIKVNHMKIFRKKINTHKNIVNNNHNNNKL